MIDVCQVKQNLCKYNINKDSNIILSISGGVDSLVLYYIISSFIKPSNLHIIHVNYKSHINSDKAENQVKKISEKYLKSISNVHLIKPLNYELFVFLLNEL